MPGKEAYQYESPADGKKPCAVGAGGHPLRHSRPGLFGLADVHPGPGATPLDQKVKQVRAQESYTTFAELPETYVDAVIAAEDHRFYQHNASTSSP